MPERSASLEDIYQVLKNQVSPEVTSPRFFHRYFHNIFSPQEEQVTALPVEKVEATNRRLVNAFRERFRPFLEGVEEENMYWDDEEGIFYKYESSRRIRLHTKEDQLRLTFSDLNGANKRSLAIVNTQNHPTVSIKAGEEFGRTVQFGLLDPDFSLSEKNLVVEVLEFILPEVLEKDSNKRKTQAA